MEITMRHAISSDLDTLVRFNSAMAQETEEKELALETLRRGISAILDDASRGFYLVAEAAGEPVAQLMVTNEWSDWRNSWFYWLQSLYVRPEFRRQGVFRLMYRYVERQARQSGNVCGIRLYVERTNTRAQEAYVNLGMAHSHYDMYEVEF